MTKQAVNRFKVGDRVRNTSGYIGVIVEITSNPNFPYKVDYGDQIVLNRDISLELVENK